MTGRKLGVGLVVLGIAVTGLVGWQKFAFVKIGKQPNGNFIVSSGQEINPGTIAFDGRPADFALHPEQDLLAVMTNREVFITSDRGVLARTRSPLPRDSEAGFAGVIWTGDRRGVNWTPNGMRFVVSTNQGYLQEYLYEDLEVMPKEKIWLVDEKNPRQVWPGAMCLGKKGDRLYVAIAELGEVAEIDLAEHKKVRSFPVERLPFGCQLSEDGKTLVVSNWGGRVPRKGDRTGKTGSLEIVVDSRGTPASGTVSLIDLASGKTTTLPVGLHPNGIAIARGHAYVANGMSDSVSDIDIAKKRVVRTISTTPFGIKIAGGMSNAVAVQGNRLYVANGGDNALAEIDLATGKMLGLRPAGFFPCSIQLSHDGKTAFVLNSKGNGSVANTLRGNPGNPHDFQGTISVLHLAADLKKATARVAELNHWNQDTTSEAKKLAVYNGAIKHVLYIIKENQTYDSIFGDMPQGNGDPKLCVLGEKVMPNHRKLARDFTLFDNGYVSGTNSADGHAWSTQAIANDYMEHEYVGYRTYPDDGDCAMALSATGAIWDAALKKGKSLRVYGEYCDDALATFSPREPKDWFEAWEDRKSGRNQFKFHAETRVPSLKPYICRDLHYWPIIQSDQSRADVFLREYEAFSRANKVPNLMILTLTNDHGSGLDPKFPTIRAMAADNDLAFGRVVEAISKSPQWKNTAIFVIEDDGQALPDHVDGHRTPYYVISPYTKRGHVDHNFYTTVSMIKSMEMMLGLDPMNRFDWVTAPITACFTNRPDLRPYKAVPNNIPLDERNAPAQALTAEGRRWLAESLSLDWSHVDSPDPAKLRRINWYAHTGGKPYPEEFEANMSDED
ncbi:MAG: alkaline phosphatase family protein [Fimbriimonas sp.]